MQTLRWDIFCRVIDNFGDIGVCWRLSCALATRGQTVRFWVDDASALAWMAPDGCDGVQVMRWQPEQQMPLDAQPSDVVIEAFGCDVDHTFIAMNLIANRPEYIRANGLNGLKKPVWINLEYLSAEPYVERSHGLRSPVLQGAAQGLDKWFFYPGFTAKTGGLIHAVQAMQEAAPLLSSDQRRISLFCYEPLALQGLLGQLESASQRTQLLVMPGRGMCAMKAIRVVKAVFEGEKDLTPLNIRGGMLSIEEQSYYSQLQYDALLQGCDLNFVRGEDSLARALLAGRAFVWQIYPQSDGAHSAKLEAFLDWLQAPNDLREFHRVWNGLSSAALPLLDIPNWTACAQAAQQRLLAQTDLVTQLLDFVQEKRF